MLVSVLQSLAAPPIGLAAFPSLGMLWEIIHFLLRLALPYCAWDFVRLSSSMTWSHKSDYIKYKRPAL